MKPAALRLHLHLAEVTLAFGNWPMEHQGLLRQTESDMPTSLILPSSLAGGEPTLPFALLPHPPARWVVSSESPAAPRSSLRASSMAALKINWNHPFQLDSETEASPKL